MKSINIKGIKRSKKRLGVLGAAVVISALPMRAGLAASCSCAPGCSSGGGYSAPPPAAAPPPVSAPPPVMPSGGGQPPAGMTPGAMGGGATQGIMPNGEMPGVGAAGGGPGSVIPQGGGDGWVVPDPGAPIDTSVAGGGDYNKGEFVIDSLKANDPNIISHPMGDGSTMVITQNSAGEGVVLVVQPNGNVIKLDPSKLLPPGGESTSNNQSGGETKPEETTTQTGSTQPQSGEGETPPQTANQSGGQPRPPIRPTDMMTVHPGVSPGTAQQVENALNGIPPEVRAHVHEQGANVEVAPQVTDARPDLKDQTPRGWQGSGQTWDNADGMGPVRGSDGKLTNVVVAENKIDPSTGQVVKSDRVEGVTRHEFGHGADAAFQDFSNSPEFMAAYNKDLQNMNPADKPLMNYYIQGDGAHGGPSETFADCFAHMHGGAADAVYDPYLAKNFPNVIIAIKAKEATLSPPQPGTVASSGAGVRTPGTVRTPPGQHVH